MGIALDLGSLVCHLRLGQDWETDVVKAKNTMTQTLQGMSSTAGEMSVVFSAAAKASLGFAATFTAVGGVLYGLRKFSEAAIQAQDTQARFNVTFGESNRVMTVWANGLASTMKRSADDIQGYAVRFQNAFQGIGLSDSMGRGFTAQLTEIGYAMSRRLGLPVEDVMQRINMAILGNTRGLRELNVVITDASLKAYAMSKGYTKAGEELTALGEAYTRVQMILEQGLLYQKDSANIPLRAKDAITQYKDACKDLREELGTHLLPLLTELYTDLTNITRASSKGIQHMQGSKATTDLDAFIAEEFHRREPTFDMKYTKTFFSSPAKDVWNQVRDELTSQWQGFIQEYAKMTEDQRKWIQENVQKSLAAEVEMGFRTPEMAEKVRDLYKSLETTFPSTGNKPNAADLSTVTEEEKDQAKQLAAEHERLASERVTLTAQMYGQIGELDAKWYGSQLDALDALKKQYEAKGIDRVLIDKWAMAQEVALIQEQQDADQKQMDQETKQREQAIKLQEEEINKRLEQQETTRKMLEDRVRSTAQMYDKIGAYDDIWFHAQMSALELDRTAYEQVGIDKVHIEEEWWPSQVQKLRDIQVQRAEDAAEKQKRVLKDQQEAAERIIQANAQLYQGLGHVTGAYEAQLALLDDQKKRYEEIGADLRAINAWYQRQIELLDIAIGKNGTIVDQLKAAAAELRIAAEEAGGPWYQFTKELPNLLENGLMNMLQNMHTWTDAMKSMLKEIYFEAIRIAFIKPAANAAAQAFTTIGTAVVGGIAGSYAGGAGSAGMGQAGSGGYHQYAEGGIAWSPQIASIAENEPELITPLSKLGTMGGKVTVNVINQSGTPLSVSKEEQYMMSDERIINVMVSRMDTDGRLQKAMGTRR
jgi:hypothetical protein